MRVCRVAAYWCWTTIGKCPRHLLYQLFPYAIQELPEHVSVLVARAAKIRHRRWLRCNATMTVIGADSLTLSRVEAKAIVQLHWKKKADGAIRTFVDEAYRRVGGWAAGLMLMVEQAKGDRRCRGVDSTAHPRRSFAT